MSTPSRLSVLALLLAGCAPGAEVGVAQQPLSSGQVETGYPEVGHMIWQDATYSHSCTATLIGTRTALSAAHCVPDATSRQAWVDFGTGNVATIVASEPHPSYTLAAQSANYDVSVIHLDRDIKNIRPATLATTAPVVGEPIKIVAFGTTPTDESTDTKRSGTNTIGSLAAGYFDFNGSDATHANSCPGDSGGPIFVTRTGGKQLIAGVDSRGNCIYGSGASGAGTRVDAYVSFIQSKAAANLFDGVLYEQLDPVASFSLPSTWNEGEPLSVKFSAADDVRVVHAIVSIDEKLISDVAGEDPTLVLDLMLSPKAGKRVVRFQVTDGAGRTAEVSHTIEIIAPESTTPTDPVPEDPGTGAETPSAHGCSHAGGTNSAGLPFVIALFGLTLVCLRRRCTA